MINSTKASRLLAPIAALALSASPASATWSILITDTRTGEFVLGSATCLTGFDLARETPLVLTGIGAITAQSAVDLFGTNRMFVRDRLLEGQPLNQILAELAINDPGHDNRQYGMITTTGQSLTYSGIQNANWAGGITGRIEQGRIGPADDTVYAVQGNILSGPNVVDDAVAALINADTDLPGKLMAGMLAARLAGGDGRCSCSPNAPTACGSPPPAPFKSAHVGYMIGSRADDTDSIRAFYQLPERSTALTQLGNNQFAVSDTDNNIHIYNNATNTNDQVAHFTFEQTIETTLPNLTKLTAADLDNNGLPDLITFTGDTTIAIFLQTEPNTFAPPVLIPMGDTIIELQPFNAENLLGDQLLVSFQNTNQYKTLQWNGTTLTQLSSTGSEVPITAATFGDINNDNLIDIVYVGPNCLGYLPGNGDGTFGNGICIQTSADPIQVRLAHLNDDNQPDYLVATGSSQSINAFFNDPNPDVPFGSFTPVNSPIAAPAIDFTATDLNNDGFPDLAVLFESGPNLRYYLGDGAGNFTETDRTRIGGTPTDALLADLNNDGDQDLITTADDKLLIYDNLQNATVQRQTGFARGDKFMFINIANQFSGADDPVDQMLIRFEDFRASLVGKVDAVQTTVTTPSRILIDDPNLAPSIRVELRDYQSNLLTSPATFTLHFNPNNLTPALPEFVAPGIYDIPLRALSDNNAAPGNHQLKIQATTTTKTGPHTVTLMPSLTIATTTNLADFNADNAHNFIDISIFISALSSHNPIADLNNDTFFNTDDIALFLNAYKSAP